MLVCGSLLRQLKKGLILTFMLSTFVSIASFSNNIHISEERLPKLTQIEQTLHDLKGIAKVDSSRERWMKKILNIINQYNPKLPATEKTKIASEIYNMSIRYPNLDVKRFHLWA